MLRDNDGKALSGEIQAGSWFHTPDDRQGVLLPTYFGHKFQSDMVSGTWKILILAQNIVNVPIKQAACSPSGMLYTYLVVIRLRKK